MAGAVRCAESPSNAPLPEPAVTEFSDSDRIPCGSQGTSRAAPSTDLSFCREFSLQALLLGFPCTHFMHCVSSGRQLQHHCGPFYTFEQNTPETIPQTVPGRSSELKNKLCAQSSLSSATLRSWLRSTRGLSFVWFSSLLNPAIP